ncbi:MAG: hypothetical protein ACK5MR_02025 [Cumulibacter sp.]
MNLFKSELRKFFSTRTWLWLLIGTVAIALIQVAFMLAAAGTKDSSGMPVFPEITSPEMQALVLSAPASATIFISILGILAVTTEYRHGTISTTYLATPHRWQVLVAKLGTYLLLGVLYAVVAAIFTVVLTAIWVGSAGGSLSLGGDNAKILIGATVAAALYGVIGVSVGALIPNQIGAVTGFLAYTFVVESILSGVPATQDTIYPYLPGGAAAAMYTYADIPGAGGIEYLAPVAGGFILAGYAVVVGALAYVLSSRREVT